MIFITIQHRTSNPSFCENRFVISSAAIVVSNPIIVSELIRGMIVERIDSTSIQLNL